MADTTAAPREMVSRSGIPFQLAVTEAIQQIAGLHGLVDIRTEVPYSDGFLDLVVLKDTVCFVIECKRADEKQWVFPVTAKSLDVARLRVEWRCGGPGESSLPGESPKPSALFCDDGTIPTHSAESQFCVVPKNTAVASLEQVCQQLVTGCHDLLSNEQIAWGRFAVAVPVLITNATLLTCELEPAELSTETGYIQEGQGRFGEASLIRFRKSFVTSRPREREGTPVSLRDWTADHERTVFVLRPPALDAFFDGFRNLWFSDGWGMVKPAPPRFYGEHLARHGG